MYVGMYVYKPPLGDIVHGKGQFQLSLGETLFTISTLRSHLEYVYVYLYNLSKTCALSLNSQASQPGKTRKIHIGSEAISYLCLPTKTKESHAQCNKSSFEGVTFFRGFHSLYFLSIYFFKLF